MPPVRSARLVDAWVGHDATVREAAGAMTSAGISAIAVLRSDRRVAGLFTELDLIGTLVPPYLRELRHTAFAQDDVSALARRAREVGGEAVAVHLTSEVELEADTSLTHAAERFLHARCDALAVVERGRFVGMLPRSELARLLLQQSEPA
jgi:CBS domain-containing protein